MSITQDREQQREKATFVDYALKAIKGTTKLELRAGDQTTELSQEDAELLLELLKRRAQGLRVTVTSLPDTVTTGQAADILGVSRPTVVKLVDDGKLSASRIGTHRKVLTADVLKLKEDADTAVSEGVDELAVLTDEFGLRDT